MAQRADVAERLEGTRQGRALISAFLIVTLVAVVVTNLPDSHLRRQVQRVSEPYLHATGLDQAWRLFGPEPRRYTIGLRASITYADGRGETWRPPAGGDLVDGYWDYHWQKWQEWVMDVRHRDLWRPAAEFVAREHRSAGRRPVRVTLVRVTSLNRPPGRGPDAEPAVAQPYYTLRLP
ncbi:MAG TPA: hypothetical protein VJT75_01205 [Thermoleophilaceae bacterium]|nr:hypothetical protein [Thermoleophilaceae bacterium]